MIEIVFWLMLFIVFFTYIGYGLVVCILVRIRRHRETPGKVLQEDLPTVVHLIPAYNEESYIREKIINSQELSYPEDKYEVWVVSDGSTDGTATIVESLPNVIHFHEPKRRGKIHAVNRVLKEVTSDIVVFSDANTTINKMALFKMVRHFKNSEVGVVAGEKRIEVDAKDEVAIAGEGLYWKYESFLKLNDYRLYSTVGAAGELFAIRTALFEPVPDDTIIEDFYLSLQIASNGNRIAYEPEAYAVESGSATMNEESKRKIRISAGGLQAIWRLRKLLNIFRYGWLSFQFIGHRVLRWTIAPVLLPFILISNGILVFESNFLYLLLFIAQMLFYLLAFFGWRFQALKTKLKLLFIPYYFVFMNWAVYRGLLRIIWGKQSVLWERAKRMT